jgi:hypothetical protein
MRIVFIAPAALLCVLIGPVAHGQSLPTKKEATELIEKTIPRMRLVAPGRSPFHLVADVRFEIGANSFEGTYELLWASPDRYREEFRVGTVGETDVAQGDKIYILRTTPTLSYTLERVRFYVDMPVPTHLASTRHVRKIYLETVSGQSQFCVRTDSNGYDEEFCFDMGTREIVSLRSGNSAIYRWERTEFVAVDGSRYPGRVLHHSSGETLEMHVTRLESVREFSESVFTPPPTASMRDWCADPKKSGKWMPPDAPILSFANNDTILLYYVLVGPDGQVEKSAPVVSVTGPIDATIERWIHEAKFAIWRCGDKAIEYEQIIAPYRTP